MVLGALALAAGGTGVLEVTGHVDLPMALEPLRERLPVVFPLHMGASALALILIVAALCTRRRPALHRLVGRTAVVLIFLGGVAALPSALLSSAGSVARAGFFAQAVVWLGLAALGYGAIRARRVARHRAAMLLMAAVAFGAVMLRLMLFAIAWLEFDVLWWYGPIAWLAWLVPFGFVCASLAVGKRRLTAHKGRAPLGAATDPAR